MKKIVAVMAAIMLLLAPARMAVAHENCPIEKGIMDVLLFPFKVVIWVVMLPVHAVEELTHKHPHEHEHSHGKEGKAKSGC